MTEIPHMHGPGSLWQGSSYGMDHEIYGRESSYGIEQEVYGRESSYSTDQEVYGRKSSYAMDQEVFLWHGTGSRENRSVSEAGIAVKEMPISSSQSLPPKSSTSFQIAP